MTGTEKILQHIRDGAAAEAESIRQAARDAVLSVEAAVTKLLENVLARNVDTPVEAAEIRHGNGVFWGVQYHPEFKSRPNRPHPLFCGLIRAALDIVFP